MLSFKNMKSTIGTVPCQTLFNFLSTEKDQTSFNIWHFKRLILWSWLLFQRADIYFYNAFAILLTLFVWGRMGFWLTGGEMRISRYLWSMLLDDVWMMSLHALQPTNGRSCCHGDLFFFFFPVVKCGQSLKQWNECVNLHKGKERHSRVLECLCLCMCVCDCVQKCVCAFETFLLPIPAQLYLTVHSQLCNIWLMLYRVLTYKVCWLQNKWMLFTVYVFGC